MSNNHKSDDETEIIDVVDENDNVVKQMSKYDVHAGYQIYHREIGVLVYDNQGRVLLQQRSLNKKYFPGKWTVTSVGHVPTGKTPEEAAHIELKEELGFDTFLKFVEKRKYLSGDHVSFGYLFIGAFPEKATVVIDKDEVEQAKFVSHSEANKMVKLSLLDYHTEETLEKYYHNEFKLK